jgi:NIMA (never in mitosis gene a)-related kinase
LVERLEDGALLAMKRVLIDDQAVESAALNREVEVLAKLKHQNIVHYYESFVSGKYLCIVMDYCAYGDLSQKIKAAQKSGTHFSEGQIWDWLAQLCRALDHIHSNRVIHRDLKTQNVFVSASQELKIGDFGISRVLLHSDELARTSIGTPYYLAPEICHGRPYDNKADLWSLGCILYELCCLKRPYEADSLIALLHRISTCEYEQIPEQYSPELASMVALLLKKNPEDRPALSWILQELGPSIGDHAPSGICLTDLEERPRKAYQKEMLINIPSPISQSQRKHPGSAPACVMPSSLVPSNNPSLQLKPQLPITAPSTPLITGITGCAACVTSDLPFDEGCSETTSNSNVGVEKQCSYESVPTQRTRHHFTFSESLLKQCPNSPNRPFLMGDFLKKKLGTQVFETIKRILQSVPCPAKLLREEPWIISDICGQENLSIIDVGIAFDAFSDRVVPYPPTSTHKSSVIRVFPMVRRE